MSYYLFDNWKPAVALALVIEVVLLVLWQSFRSRIKPAWLLVGPVMIAVALLADYLVETPREQLERLTRAVVQNAEQENAEAIIAQLSDNFMHQNKIDKSKAAAIIRRYLSRPLIESNKITRLLVADVSPRSGSVDFTVITVFDRRSPYAGIVPLIKSSWRFTFHRDSSDDSYRVTDMTMTRFNNSKGIDVFTHRGFSRALR